MFDDLIPKPQGGGQFAGAISSVESGGRYDALGPQTRTGDRAYGKYQVMGANIPEWSQEVFGRRMTPEEFVANPEAQDAIFNAKFGSYVQKYGPEGAAKAWFAGERGMNNPNARDILGTTVSGYAEKFNKALGPQTMGFAPQEQKPQGAGLSFDDLIPQQQAQAAPTFDQRFQQPDTQNPALQSGLEQRAAQMTTGPQQAPAAQLAVSQRNLMSGAQQGTSPHPDQYKGKLVSAETFESDSGEVMYRDPATGQVVPTDQTKQVALRDPADGVIKVYDRSDATNESGVTGAARVLAPGLASGAATARPSIPVSSKEIVPKASDIFATSKAPYRKFDEIAGKIEVPHQTAAGFVERIEGALEKAKVPRHLAEEVFQSVGQISRGTAPKEAGGLARLEAEMNALPIPTTPGKPITLDHLRDVKELVGKSFESTDSRVRQAAAVVSREIGKIISEVSPEAGASLKQADAIHSTARAVQDLQRKSDVAGLRAARTGYGGNSVNTMRQEIGKIVQRATEGKTTMLKPDELAAAREIVEGNNVTNTLRLVGQLSPSKGIMQTAASGGALYAAGPAALAIPALGAASNKLATVLTGKQIDHLKTMVAKRSPAYAEAVAKATEKYERAQMELVNNPSPAKFAAYLSASRALSSGLQRDGVQITAGDLIRQLQGPMKAAADDESPEPERGVQQ